MLVQKLNKAPSHLTTNGPSFPENKPEAIAKDTPKALARKVRIVCMRTQTLESINCTRCFQPA